MIENLGITKKLKVCRIGHPSRIMSHLNYFTLDSLILKTSSSKILKQNKLKCKGILKKISKTTKKEYEKRLELKKELKLLRKECKDLENLAIEEVINSSEVILCTNTGAADKILEKNSKVFFDYLIIDEAAQALEVSCWIPILRSKKLILAGDHKQLPPTVKCLEADKLGLSKTLFERLIENKVIISKIILLF